MSVPLMIRSTVSIQAPAAKVWNALVNPEETKKYMFGCEALSDWKPGSPLLWKGVYNGAEMVFVKGEVVDIMPETYLAYTVIDPNNQEIPDIPENYLTIIYSLEASGGGVQLTVTQGDYSKVAQGDKRYEEAVQGGGWDSLLETIKKQVEGN